MAYETLRENLTARGFGFSYFETKEEAAAYLNGRIDGETVGIGGSMTLQALGIDEVLKIHNTLHWHMRGGKIPQANAANVYLSSLNGLAETGELINIDGVGNRLSATAYGAKRVYFVVGKNKLAPDFEGALWRARNIAAPKNAARLKCDTPCVTENPPRCHDCRHPARICRELLIHWWKPRPVEEMEVILIGEDLGY